MAELPALRLDDADRIFIRRITSNFGKFYEDRRKSPGYPFDGINSDFHLFNGLLSVLRSVVQHLACARIHCTCA